MKNRIFILALVVVVSIFLGVTMVVSEVNAPVLRRMIAQQTEILNLQKLILTRLGGEIPSPAQMPGGQNAAAVVPPGDFSGTGDMAQKMASLEQKLDKLVMIFNGIQTGMPTGAQRPAAQRQPPSEDFTTVYNIDLKDSPRRGPGGAPVTIVGFVDLQCPYSGRFQPVIDDVLKAYPDQVNYALKHFPLPFHPQAKPAAKVLFAAGEQGKYWEMFDLLLQNASSLSDEKYEELAKTLKLNINTFKQDLKNKDADWEKRINADLAQVQECAVRGTPTYFINGRRTQSRDLESFKRDIDAILSQK